MNSFLSPLPSPLLQVFLESCFPCVLFSLFPLSVSSLLFSNHRSQALPWWGIALFFLTCDPGNAKSFVLHTAPLNIDQQEVLWGASFLNLQHFKKKMKTSHCVWSEVQVPSANYGWNRSIYAPSPLIHAYWPLDRPHSLPIILSSVSDFLFASLFSSCCIHIPHQLLSGVVFNFFATGWSKEKVLCQALLCWWSTST